MLALVGAAMRYGESRALAPVDLEIPAGAVTALIGPSGCGKSTLLRLLLGLATPDAGRIQIEGGPLRPEMLLAWRRCGYVIQEGGLFPRLTARGNAALLARGTGRARRRDGRGTGVQQHLRARRHRTDRGAAEARDDLRSRRAPRIALRPDPRIPRPPRRLAGPRREIRPARGRTAILALPLHRLLPIVRNTATGLQTIPPALRESAAALGLEPGAQLRFVFLPLASRTILAGIKTSAIWILATATLAALIGAGGLGEPIVSGLNLNDPATLLEGAIPAAVLALLIQGLFELLDRVLVPRGLRIKGGICVPNR